MLSKFSYSTQDHQSKVGPIQMDWNFPHQSLPTDMPMAPSYEEIFSIETVSTQMALDYIKLT